MSSRALLALIPSLITVLPLSANVRVFMSLDGEQAGQPVNGATFMQMEPNTTARIIVWMEDSTGIGGEMNSYQIIMRDRADPREGSVGVVNYVNNSPGEPGGDSMFIDDSRPDWLYASVPVLVPAHYNETPPANIFGVIYALPLGLSVNPAELGGIRYLCEFEFRSSLTAEGVFDLRFNVAPKPPPLSALFNGFGGEYIVNTKWQPLTITIGNPAPVSSGPPDGAIDARQPLMPGRKQPVGWDEVELMFQTPTEVTAEHFAVHTTDGTDIVVDEVVEQDHTTLLRLDRPIPPGACTTIEHLPSGWQTQLGYLPGDVDNDGQSGVLDILSLVDHLNGTSADPVDPWQCDIDRSGACDPQDILALIDLLNGANRAQAWNGATLSCGK